MNKCRPDRCFTLPRHGIADREILKYCAKQGLDGMLDVCRTRYGSENCMSMPDVRFEGIIGSG